MQEKTNSENAIHRNVNTKIKQKIRNDFGELNNFIFFFAFIFNFISFEEGGLTASASLWRNLV